MLWSECFGQERVVEGWELIVIRITTVDEALNSVAVVVQDNAIPRLSAGGLMTSVEWDERYSHDGLDLELQKVHECLNGQMQTTLASDEDATFVSARLADRLERAHGRTGRETDAAKDRLSVETGAVGHERVGDAKGRGACLDNDKVAGPEEASKSLIASVMSGLQTNGR